MRYCQTQPRECSCKGHRSCNKGENTARHANDPKGHHPLPRSRKGWIEVSPRGKGDDLCGVPIWYHKGRNNPNREPAHSEKRNGLGRFDRVDDCDPLLVRYHQAGAKQIDLRAVSLILRGFLYWVGWYIISMGESSGNRRKRNWDIFFGQLVIVDYFLQLT